MNGAAGDTAGLTITNVANPNDTDSAVATVPAGGVRSTDSAELTIIPGETVTLSETLPAVTHTNTGSYDPTSLLCNGQPVTFTVTGTGATATFTVPSSAPVSCVYTNTRQQATVVLQKHWNNGATGDSADLSITGGVTDPATATSTVTAATGSTFTDTTNQATTDVHTGDQVTVAEDLPGANTGSYDTTLACDNGVTPNADGTFTVTAAMVATTVTCTVTNTRHRRDVDPAQDLGERCGRGHRGPDDHRRGQQQRQHLHGAQPGTAAVRRHRPPGRRTDPVRADRHRGRGTGGGQHR